MYDYLYIEIQSVYHVFSAQEMQYSNIAELFKFWIGSITCEVIIGISYAILFPLNTKWLHVDSNDINRCISLYWRKLKFKYFYDKVT